MQTTASTGGMSVGAAQQHVDGHHLVAGTRGQAVEARQVDQLVPPAVVVHPPGLLLDRHARIVAHALTDADQGAEERRLARVRVADQGNGEQGLWDRAGHVAGPLAPLAAALHEDVQ